MSGEFTLPNGNTVELYEPYSSGRAPMRAGSCPGCAESTYSFTGRYAAIRELDASRRPVTESRYVRSYGHLECMWYVLERLMLDASAPGDDGKRWIRGRQRDLVDFVARHENETIEVRFDRTRDRDQRYSYRLEDGE